jgi:hypothetical protein
MQAPAASSFPIPLQSRDALMTEPIPWTDRQLTSENLKALLLARLPDRATGRDIETLFQQLDLRNANRQGDRIQAQVRARPRYWPTPAYWLVTALVDGDDRVVSFEVQYLSGM